jgi:predicted porin
MHRKKILAVAVAGALSGSVGAAFAAGGAESSYSIYGKLYPQVSSYDYSGATRPGTTQSDLISATSTVDTGKRAAIEVSNSRIGFRGSESLGGDLKAIFQIETRVRFDTGAGNVWAGGRNSYVGLTGAVGTLKLGNMDTAYKEVGDTVSFLGISSGNFVSSSGVLSEGPFTDLSFHVRQPNVIMYESPKFVGLQFLGSWGKDELKGNPNHSFNALLNSYALTYEMGSLYLALAHERHHDFFPYDNSNNVTLDNPTTGATVRSNDNATRFTVNYKLGQTTLYLDAAQIELKDTGAIAAGDFTGYKNKRIAVGVQHRFGNITAQAAVVNSDEGTCTREGGVSCSTTGLEGRHYNLGASYAFSRRTQAFAILSKLDQGVSASYSITGNSVAEAQVGEDVTAIAVGVNHNF